jgi:hypothetical protein
VFDLSPGFQSAPFTSISENNALNYVFHKFVLSIDQLISDDHPPLYNSVDNEF